MSRKVSSRILFASANQGKLQEAQETARPYSIEIIGAQQISLEYNLPDIPQVSESGKNYLENAALKAQAFFLWSGGLPTLADDSGLEVKALGFAPGVLSARYAGECADDTDNVNKLLRELEGVVDRSASFLCYLYLKTGQSTYLTAHGELRGRIAHRPSGSGGFGYDPLFIPEGYEKSLAYLKQSRGAPKTHRVAAFEKLFSALGINA
mgnify:CR=1 FL=1